MPVRTYARCALSILTGLWVTVGAAIPIEFLLLTLVKRSHGGELGPELLTVPSVYLSLLAGYALAAAIGGWAAGWVTIERNYRLLTLLSVSHVGTWLFALGAGAVPFPVWFALALAAAAVVGTVVGVGLRTWQVSRWARIPYTD